MTERTIDYEPLTQRVSLKDVWQYVRQQKTARPKRPWVKVLYRSVAVIILVPIIVGILRSSSTAELGIWLLIIIAGVCLHQLYKYTVNTRHVKLSRFAAANDLSYTMLLAGAPHDGLIFNTGYARFASEIVADYHETHGFEIANYRYDTGSGRSRRTHNYHYIMLKLPRRLPHMVLDAKKGNFLGMSNLPVSFKKAQKLQLEGDFDKYFTLYCPKEYERDALYVFTPDIMAMMIDLGAKYDVEIIDDKLFLYGNGRIRRFNKNLYKNIFHILKIFGKKMHARVDYYADEKVGDRSIDAIDVSGYRLEQSNVGKIVAIVFTILFIGFMLWLMFG